jgi:serine/threonine-protein kinase
MMRSGRLKEAREAFNRSLEISPQQSFTPYWLGVTYLIDGQAAAALATFGRSTSQVFRLAGATMAENDLGHPVESQRALDELIKDFSHSSAVQIADAYAWRGEKDLAFKWLDRAWVQRDGGLVLLKASPLSRNLHGDPRYTALLKKLNLPVD